MRSETKIANIPLHPCATHICYFPLPLAPDFNINQTQLKRIKWSILVQKSLCLFFLSELFGHLHEWPQKECCSENQQNYEWPVSLKGHENDPVHPLRCSVTLHSNIWLVTLLAETRNFLFQISYQMVTSCVTLEMTEWHMNLIYATPLMSQKQWVLIFPCLQFLSEFLNNIMSRHNMYRFGFPLLSYSPTKHCPDMQYIHRSRIK